MRKVWLAAGLVWLSAACASKPVKNADLVLIDQADARVLEGCYDCLIDARTAYVKLAAGKARPVILPRLFEVELLLTLREKELDLDFAPSLARARDLLKELPAPLEAARYVAVVEGIPSDEIGIPRAEMGRFRQAAGKTFVPTVDAEIQWLSTAVGFSQPFRQYLSLAADCTSSGRPRQQGQLPFASRNRDPGPAAPPLVTYRFAICDRVIARAPIEHVYSTVPRFVEAAYFLARRELADQKQTKVRELLAPATRRFPQSSALTYFNGSFNQLIGDCKAGLGYYDETIALQPLHENALLGRAICLTYLKRQQEAIQAATRIIDLKLDNIHEGYYWRAWNYHFLQQLVPARSDIEAAKRMRSTSEIHTLAGIIEHDQDDLSPAEKDLIIAKSMSGGEQNCTARWYLGLVEMKREKWIESGAHFEDAMGCYANSVVLNEFRRDNIAKTPDLDPEFVARQIAGFEAAIKEDRTQQYSSAFNAANHYARGGNREKAKVLVEIAAAEPSLATRVADLKRILSGGESRPPGSIF